MDRRKSQGRKSAPSAETTAQEQLRRLQAERARIDAQIAELQNTQSKSGRLREQEDAYRRRRTEILEREQTLSVSTRLYDKRASEELAAASEAAGEHEPIDWEARRRERLRQASAKRWFFILLPIAILMVWWALQSLTH